MSFTTPRLPHRRAFGLVDLILVVVVLVAVAVVAVPRMSRATGATVDNELLTDLIALRGAIALYRADHGGANPPLEHVSAALTSYSDAAGSTFGERDASRGVFYGPYIAAIPPLPVGDASGKSEIVGRLGESGGWVYDSATGTIIANTLDREVDAGGRKYNQY